MTEATQAKFTGKNIKLHLILRLEYNIVFGKCWVPIHYNYSQVHSNPEWLFILESYLWLKQNNSVFLSDIISYLFETTAMWASYFYLIEFIWPCFVSWHSKPRTLINTESCLYSYMFFFKWIVSWWHFPNKFALICFPELNYIKHCYLILLILFIY